MVADSLMLGDSRRYRANIVSHPITRCPYITSSLTASRDHVVDCFRVRWRVMVFLTMHFEQNRILCRPY